MGCSAGSDPDDLPKAVNSMIPSGAERGQLSIVSLTNRQLVGLNCSKIVFLAISFELWSSTVVKALPSVETSILYW